MFSLKAKDSMVISILKSLQVFCCHGVVVVSSFRILFAKLVAYEKWFACIARCYWRSV